MSITTKTGDAGMTGLMYNRRVSKCCARVAAYGSVDELNAALGLARAFATDACGRSALLAIQKDLIVLMGELATATEDLTRYQQDGFHLVGPAMTSQLETLAREMEAQQAASRGWVLPGDTPEGAAVDLARTACRRAERRVCSLLETGELQNAQILVYLNRLSDLLWLLERRVATPANASA